MNSCIVRFGASVLADSILYTLTSMGCLSNSLLIRQAPGIQVSKRSFRGLKCLMCQLEPSPTAHCHFHDDYSVNEDPQRQTHYEIFCCRMSLGFAGQALGFTPATCPDMLLGRFGELVYSQSFQ